MRRILLGLSLSCLAVGATGCPPPGAPDSSMMRGDEACEAVFRTDQLSRQTGEAHYLSETELLRLKGIADLRIKMGEFPHLIRSDWEQEPDYSPEYVDYKMEGLYNMYRWALEDRGETVDANATNWRTSKRFNNLNVWFYDFHTGREIRVYGGVLPFVGRGTGAFAVSCFLLEDSRVLECSGYTRPLYRRKRAL